MNLSEGIPSTKTIWMVYSAREGWIFTGTKTSEWLVEHTASLPIKIKIQDVAFGDFTLTEREALFEDVSHSIEVKSHYFNYCL